MVGDLALYPTSEDYAQRRSEHSVRVEADRGKRDLMPFQLKMCLVEGTFHVSHDARNRNSIGEVSHFELAE
jgi:hypothetical protein